MEVSLSELANILDQEIAVAEKLENNLTAQKQAMVDWNVDGLLAQIEAREPCVRVLEGLEQKRLAWFSQNGVEPEGLTLSGWLITLPPNSADLVRMRGLQQHIRSIFSRLQDDEQFLHGVMLNMLAHIHEALGALSQAPATLYGESGAAEAQRTSSALLQSRA